MTGTVQLSDQGQDYIHFSIIEDLITRVRPSGRPGWKYTKILNNAFLIGGRLIIELHNGYRLALRYPIVNVTLTPE